MPPTDYRPRSAAMHMLMHHATRAGTLALRARMLPAPGTPASVALADARTSAADARAALALAVGVHPDDVDPVLGTSSAAPTVTLPWSNTPTASAKRVRRAAVVDHETGTPRA